MKMRQWILAALLLGCSIVIGDAAPNPVTGVPQLCQTANGGPTWLGTSNGTTPQTLISGTNTNGVKVSSLAVGNLNASTPYVLTLELTDGTNTFQWNLQIPAGASTVCAGSPVTCTPTFNFEQAMGNLVLDPDGNAVFWISTGHTLKFFTTSGGGANLIVMAQGCPT
jgi:hypothetical protein